MLRCINVVGRHLEAKVKDLHAQLLAEAQALKPEELLRLPGARTYATVFNEARMSLKKLKSIRRHAEKNGWLYPQRPAPEGGGT